MLSPERKPTESIIAKSDSVTGIVNLYNLTLSAGFLVVSVVVVGGIVLGAAEDVIGVLEVLICASLISASSHTL